MREPSSAFKKIYAIGSSLTFVLFFLLIYIFPKDPLITLMLFAGIGLSLFIGHLYDWVQWKKERRRK